MMVSIVRQPDSDTFRFWEMAGTAHAGGESAELMTAALGTRRRERRPPRRRTQEHDRLGLHRPRRVGAPRRVDRHWASTRVDSADHVRSCCGHRPRRDRQRARRGARARSGRAARRSHRHAERAVRCSIEWAIDTLDCSSASASSTRTPRRFQNAWDQAIDDLADLGLVVPSSCYGARRCSADTAPSPMLMAAWSTRMHKSLPRDLPSRPTRSKPAPSPPRSRALSGPPS